MKHPEYDSPIELTIGDITTQMAKNIDEMCWQAVQRVGVNVDKEKLLFALKQDAKRYREAYRNGYNTGYEKRDEEIIRCEDCKHFDGIDCRITGIVNIMDTNFFCAEGERKEETE